MSEINITVTGGTSKRLLTAGKYCDRDIIVTAEGGGAGGQVGEFTKYAKFVATPTTATSFTIQNPLGGMAKKVFVQRIATDVTSSRRIRKYIADSDFGMGAIELVDTSGSVRYVARKVSSTPNNSEFAIDDGSITLYRYNSANAWHTGSEYIVEIYQ